MTRVINLPGIFIRALLVAGFWLIAAAPMTGIGAVRAQAQNSSGLFGFRTNIPQQPDWVRKTRPPPEELYDRKYRVPAVEPEGAPMSAGELRKVEAEMNALRSRHDRAAGRRPTPPGKSAAAPPREKKANGTPPCVLTCNIGLGRVTGK